MANKSTPQAALIAWMIRNDRRWFWFENLDSKRIKLRMIQSSADPRETKAVNAYVNVETDADGDVDEFLIDTLIAQGLDKWKKEYKSLV